MGISHNKITRQKGHVDNFITDDLSSAMDALKLDAKEESFDGCFSTEEIVEKTKRCKAHVQEFIKKSIKDGDCEFVGKRSGIGIDGRVTKTPVYKFKFKKKRGTS